MKVFIGIIEWIDDAQEPSVHISIDKAVTRGRITEELLAAINSDDSVLFFGEEPPVLSLGVTDDEVIQACKDHSGPWATIVEREL